MPSRGCLPVGMLEDVPEAEVVPNASCFGSSRCCSAGSRRRRAAARPAYRSAVRSRSRSSGRSSSSPFAKMLPASMNTTPFDPSIHREARFLIQDQQAIAAARHAADVARAEALLTVAAHAGRAAGAEAIGERQRIAAERKAGLHSATPAPACRAARTRTAASAACGSGGRIPGTAPIDRTTPS